MQDPLDEQTHGTLDLSSTLNPDQLAAVTHGDGPQLVLAGAGSGKTRVITTRIAWLVRTQDVAPWRIVAVTFTNKAAREMRERAEALLDGEAEGLFVGTFHRFALRLLRRYAPHVGLRSGFGLLDTADQLAVVKRALQAEGLAETTFPPRAVLARISGAKNRLLGPEAFHGHADNFFDRHVASVYHRYQALLRDANSLDFDDLIVFANRLLRSEEEASERLRERVRYLLVDEFQDTNHAQLQMIEALIANGNLTAVGDEDQGIYRWRGAELDNILKFEEHFAGATVRKLERNYRSTQNILDASGAVIAHNQRRRGKRLWTESGSGERIELYRATDETDEARRLVARLRELHGQHRYGEMAILVRTNAQTRALEDELLNRQVPYCLVAGVRFYERAEIKDVVSYLRLIQQPADNLAFVRVLNRPARGVGKATRALLEEEAAELGNSLWDVLRLDRLAHLPRRGRQALRTFHDLILELQEVAKSQPLPECLRTVLERTRYAAQYQPEEPEGAARLENLSELISAAQDFVETHGIAHLPALGDDGGSLTEFLDHVALLSEVDFVDREKGISLMTMHAAKGLEFSVVAVAGLEDGLLPHFNARGHADDVEEERRLFYVGMTRAQHRLLLSSCRRRRISGRYQDRLESPFVREIPDELLEIHQNPSLSVHPRASGVSEFFGRGEAVAGGAEADSNGLQVGSKVRHATLGDGVILEIDGEGPQAKITVFFERAGKRRLVAKHASLELL